MVVLLLSSYLPPLAAFKIREYECYHTHICTPHTHIPHTDIHTYMHPIYMFVIYIYIYVYYMTLGKYIWRPSGLCRTHVAWF